jgi:hypothetical protein
MVVYNNNEPNQGIAFIAKHFAGGELSQILEAAGFNNVQENVKEVHKPSLFEVSKYLLRKIIFTTATK